MKLCALILAAFYPASTIALAQAVSPVDMQRIVSRADLGYDTPARRSEEGMPMGNGRMGSLVWTTPTAAHLQINRADVFAEDCTTTSFPRTHSDYSSGCAFVDLDFGEVALAAGSSFHQHLSLFDGL